MTLTPVLALPYPVTGDTADVPRDIKALAQRLEAVLGMGTLAARPAAGSVGRRYYASDVIADYVDTGTAWVRVSVPAGSTSAILAAVPAGWVLADGSAVPNSGVTAELFAAIGSVLPDLRGRVPVGVDSTGRLTANNTLGAVGGEEKHLLKPEESGTPAHQHHMEVVGGFSPPTLINSGGKNNVRGDTAGGVPGTGLRNDNPNSAFSFQIGVGAVVGGAVNAASAHNVMQPFQALNWIVKL